MRCHEGKINRIINRIITLDDAMILLIVIKKYENPVTICIVLGKGKTNIKNLNVPIRT